MKLNDARILYVEDEEDIREELEFFLSMRVKELYVACDGTEGIAKYNAHKPDIIITDVMMAKMDGITMIKTLQNDSNESICPVIVMTAFNKSDTKLEDIEVLNVENIISKPVDPFILLEKIETILKDLDA